MLNIKYLIIIYLFVIVVFSTTQSIEDTISACYGLSIASLNLFVYIWYFERQKKKVTTGAMASLFLLASSVLVRFVVIVMFFLLGLNFLLLPAKSLLIGFVIGQIAFMINKITMVVRKNVN